MKLREAVVTTMTSADKTIGAVSLIALHATGSAAASNLTVLDGTDIKFAPIIAITANYDRDFAVPIAFANLIVDFTGTGNYSIVYAPRP